MATYDKGDLIRCSAAFTDADDNAQDPTVVGFKVRDPSNNITSYVYGTDAELVKDSTGNYHVDVDADEVGTWYYRFYSTGTGQAADESEFEIEATKF